MVKVRNDERLSRELAADGIDVLLTFSMENVFYLSGALFSLQDNLRERLAVAGFVRDGRDFLLCATNETSGIAETCHAEMLRGYVEFERTPCAALADLITEMGLADAVIGIEKRYLAAAWWEELAALLPRARLVAGDRALEVARAIKTPAHIEIIGRASRLTELAVARTIADTRPGESEKAMAIRLLNAMLEAGAQTVRHAVLTVGDNARHAHPYPSATKLLEPGDIIRIDVGGLFDGFGTDIARMAIVGEPSPAQRDHYRILRECVHEVGAGLVPGVPASAIYQRAVDAYGARGVPGYKRDHVGHSLGILGGHDRPMLEPGEETVLEEGMVIAVEPILKDSQERRYTVEDVYEVRPDGGELLTTASDTQDMALVGNPVRVG